ncbi:MAG: methyl-accepting chemotaxis protein [Proteobacteria bacterium]|nr:methyl-accepting chemotaxis protein [Pseudomonadota bacterium]
MSNLGLFDKLIPGKIKNDPIAFTKAKLVIIVIFSLNAAALVYTIWYFLTARFADGSIILLCGVVILLLLLFLKKTGSIFWVGNAITLVMFGLLTYLIIDGNGVKATSNSWYVIVVMLSIMMAGIRSGIFWGLVTAVSIVIYYYMGLTGYAFKPLPSDPTEYFVAYLVLGLIMLALGLNYERNVIRSQQIINEEKRQSKIRADELQTVNDEIQQVMEKVSTCDLSVRVNGNFRNGLNDLKQSINKTIDLLSRVIDDTKSSSVTVNANASELAKSAYSLSNTTTTLASGLEQIASSMNEVETNAQHNNNSASQAQSLSNDTLQEVRDGTERMESMLTAMQEINDTSSSVSNVIKVIDEIAFQTNLLALNAAVEAARAGKFGKGFAVVAEEVRNLAQRSSEAAKDTNSLIERSIKEVENGVSNASEVATVLSKISSGVEKVNNLVCDISSASKHQNNSIVEINKGLSQINQSNQTNSAVAQETAAASEELSTHSSQLQSDLSAFKLS